VLTNSATSLGAPPPPRVTLGGTPPASPIVSVAVLDPFGG